MTDELSIQQKRPSAAPYFGTGALLGGIGGAVAAHKIDAARKLVSEPAKYNSYEAILAESEDQFTKAVSEATGEEKTLMEKAAEARKAGVEAGKKYDADLKAFQEAYKPGELAPLEEGNNLLNQQKDLQTKIANLEKETATTVTKTSNQAIVDSEKSMQEFINQRINSLGAVDKEKLAKEYMQYTRDVVQATEYATATSSNANLVKAYEAAVAQGNNIENKMFKEYFVKYVNEGKGKDVLNRAVNAEKDRVNQLSTILEKIEKRASDPKLIKEETSKWWGWSKSVKTFSLEHISSLADLSAAQKALLEKYVGADVSEKTLKDAIAKLEKNAKSMEEAIANFDKAKNGIEAIGGRKVENGQILNKKGAIIEPPKPKAIAFKPEIQAIETGRINGMEKELQALKDKKHTRYMESLTAIDKNSKLDRTAKDEARKLLEEKRKQDIKALESKIAEAKAELERFYKELEGQAKKHAELVTKGTQTTEATLTKEQLVAKTKELEAARGELKTLEGNIQEARKALGKNPEKTAEQLAKEFAEKNGTREEFIKKAQNSFKDDLKKLFEGKMNNWKLGAGIAATAAAAGLIALAFRPSDKQA